MVCGINTEVGVSSHQNMYIHTPVISTNKQSVHSSSRVGFGVNFQHYSILALFNISANILQSMKLGRRFGHLIINNMNLSVDVFFFLGGTLVTLSFLKTLQRLKKEPKGEYYFIKFID